MGCVTLIVIYECNYGPGRFEEYDYFSWLGSIMCVYMHNRTDLINWFLVCCHCFFFVIFKIEMHCVREDQGCDS